MRLAILAFGGGLLAASSARAADPQPYQVTIKPTASKPLNAALAAVSQLVGLRAKAPVSPFALIARAHADLARFRTALQSQGYYSGTTRITIDGQPLGAPGLAARLRALPASPPVPVLVTTNPGPLYTLGTVNLRGDLPASFRQGFPLHPGQPAIAASVITAQSDLLKKLHNTGYAMATAPVPQAVAQPATHTLDVTLAINAGPRVALGPITLTGLKRVKQSYVRRELSVHQNELYSADKVEQAREHLASLPVFKSVTVTPAAAPDAAGQLPLDFGFVEALRHVVALNASYSTDLGADLGTSWTDRNLFGAGQRLSFSAAITELGGSSTVAPGYDVEAHYVVPDWRQRDQTLTFDAIGVHQYLVTYNRTALTLDAILARRLGKFLTATGGISATQEQVTQEGVTSDYSFVGLPVGLDFDSTNDLLEPTRGVRAKATITPTYSYGGVRGSAPYVLAQGTASTYLNLGKPGRSILALRGTIGAIEGATTLSLPPDQRLYAGGSDTIRGYAYQYASPQFPDGVPLGGTSLDTGTVELRQRFGAHYGVAAFVDAGQVGTSGTPFTGQFLAGVGLGARYYTAFGPIRLDIAVPLVRVPHAGSLQAYIGLGEAF